MTRRELVLSLFWLVCTVGAFMLENSPDEMQRRLSEWADLFFGISPTWALTFVGLAILAFAWYPRLRKNVATTENRLMTDKKSFLDQSISVSGENSGTISQTNNNTFNLGIKPTLELVGEPTLQANGDGTYTALFITKMTSPASRLTIQAQDTDLLGMNVSRPASSGSSMTSKMEVRKSVGDGHITESFASPSGTYEIAVKTRNNRLPRIAREIEP